MVHALGGEGATVLDVEPDLKLADVLGRRVRAAEVVEKDAGLKEGVFDDLAVC